VNPLLAIVGPTGSGKSDLAIHLALLYDAEIVNFDSLQVYRYFNIGTAKVPEPDRRGVPHHLIDILDPNESFTAGEYARRAEFVIRDIADRGKLPILVGGTGFYLRALLDGLVEAPLRDEQLRHELLSRGERRAGLLHRFLRRLDPPSATRIHANDTNKIIRAIEVCLLARQPLSNIYQNPRTGLESFITLKLGLAPDRDKLKRRLDMRSELMFRNGIVDEIRSILARSYTGEEKPFESLGYRQALAYVRSEITWEQAIEDTQVKTRQYAKRQLTWFRRESNIEWLSGFGNEPDVERSASDTVANWLKQNPPFA
jgi:tRNA dimethylallyltransferase